jgi:hypothetical protein
VWIANFKISGFGLFWIGGPRPLLQEITKRTHRTEGGQKATATLLKTDYGNYQTKPISQGVK